MNCIQKIQMSAAAIVIVSAAAGALLSPRVALADTCSSSSGLKCDIFGYCPVLPTKVCEYYAPAGCHVTAASCTLLTCGGGHDDANCTYSS